MAHELNHKFTIENTRCPYYIKVENRDQNDPDCEPYNCDSSLNKNSDKQLCRKEDCPFCGEVLDE